MTATSATDVALPVIALLGGSFDPVHYGHLRCAAAAKQVLAARELYLLPCYQSPLKQGSSIHVTGASAKQRLHMLELAVKEFPDLSIDSRELESAGPSYTAYTLRALRQELGQDLSLVFVLGWDALRYLDQWRDWQSLFELAHIAVMQRPGHSQDLSSDLRGYLAEKQAEISEVSRRASGGFISVLVPEIAISSTEIRRKVAMNQDLGSLIPEAVQQYIKAQQLYR